MFKFISNLFKKKEQQKEVAEIQKQQPKKFNPIFNRRIDGLVDWMKHYKLVICGVYCIDEVTAIISINNIEFKLVFNVDIEGKLDYQIDLYQLSNNYLIKSHVDSFELSYALSKYIMSKIS